MARLDDLCTEHKYDVVRLCWRARAPYKQVRALIDAGEQIPALWAARLAEYLDVGVKDLQEPVKIVEKKPELEPETKEIAEDPSSSSSEIVDSEKEFEENTADFDEDSTGNDVSTDNEDSDPEDSAEVLAEKTSTPAKAKLKKPPVKKTTRKPRKRKRKSSSE